MLKTSDREFRLSPNEDILGRPFTLMDMLYLATVKAAENKYQITTRYPLEDYRNIAPQKTKVIVTEESIPMTMFDIEFKEYPKINKELDASKVKWVEGTRVNNLMFDGFGADLDGIRC